MSARAAAASAPSNDKRPTMTMTALRSSGARAPQSEPPSVCSPPSLQASIAALPPHCLALGSIRHAFAGSLWQEQPSSGWLARGGWLTSLTQSACTFSKTKWRLRSAGEAQKGSQQSRVWHPKSAHCLMRSKCHACAGSLPAGASHQQPGSCRSCGRPLQLLASSPPRR